MRALQLLAVADVAVLLDVVGAVNGDIVPASGDAVGDLFLTQITTPREALPHLILVVCCQAVDLLPTNSVTAPRHADGTGDDGPDRALLRAWRETRNRAVHGPLGGAPYHGLADSEM